MKERTGSPSLAPVKNRQPTQGDWFLTNLNSVDMLILNGLRKIARFTYEHPTREANSVVDFVCVNSLAFDKTSDVSYLDQRLELDTDHLMVC